MTDMSLAHLDQDDEVIDSRTGEVLPPLARDVSPAIAAEINQQVATARRFPRRPDSDVSKEILGRATLNEEIASECQYSLRRGDKAIVGPSVRFAEIVRASYGNIRVAARFVRLDTDDPLRAAVVVEAVALDLETNNAECIPVRRSVMTSPKGGRKPTIFSADMINTTVMAAVSIARRNAILAVVPKALWIAGYQRVIRVLQGDAATLAKRRQDILDAFGRIGVEAKRVLAALDVKSVDDVTMEHMPTLVGFMTAIKDGEQVDAVLGRAEAAHEDFDRVENPLRGTTAAAAAAVAADIMARPGNGSAAPATEAPSAASAAPGPRPEAAPVADTPQAAERTSEPATGGAGGSRVVRLPSTRAEYMEHALGPRGWITLGLNTRGGEAAGVEDLREVFAFERKLRNRIAEKDGNFDEHQLTRLRQAIEARGKELE